MTSYKKSIYATGESAKYSVMSFLEGKEKTEYKDQPLDLSTRADKYSDGKDVITYPVGSELKDPHSNDSSKNPVFGISDAINFGKMHNFLQSLLSQSSDSDIRKDIHSTNIDFHKNLDEAFRKRSELSYLSHVSNYDSLSTAWKFAFRHAGQFQFTEQCLTMPTVLFPTIQDSRRYFPDLSTRMMHKFQPREALEKLSNSLMIVDRENASRISDSPQCSNSKRRKRTKVTDSRLMKRVSTDTTSNLHLTDESVMETCMDNRCSSSSQSSTSEDLTNDPKKYTLTPIHLRKAKLMFLYTRYPNSQMLKNFFPDIIFYKQNTAQLVKWFSNFREFYYSEMEKAVQRSISSGIKYSSELFVTEECELFKNLMTHFNKNRQIEVPKEFMITVQITLREFFEAFSVGKNLHQSWKKPIYKNIAKLDQPLPEFFKDFNWMLELAKEDNGASHSS